MHGKLARSQCLQPYSAKLPKDAPMTMMHHVDYISPISKGRGWKMVFKSSKKNYLEELKEYFWNGLGLSCSHKCIIFSFSSYNYSIE